MSHRPDGTVSLSRANLMSEIMLVDGVEDVILRDPWGVPDKPVVILVKHGPGVSSDFRDRVVAAIVGSFRGEGRYKLACSDDPATWAAWTLGNLDL